MQKAKCTAIVLAAGQGKRMGTKIQKQYLEIDGKPILYYSLQAFEQSELIDEIVLVVGTGQSDYCKTQMVSKYGFKKVKTIVEGGKERYHSVANGINAISWENDMVFIHDGARPFVTEEILQRAYDEVLSSHACVVGMPVKDTVKIADNNRNVVNTPNRSNVWQIQTPQVFDMDLITQAYDKLIKQEEMLLKQNVAITDDAMVVECFSDVQVKLVEGSYQNIKITTPEDIDIAKVFIAAKPYKSRD